MKSILSGILIFFSSITLSEFEINPNSDTYTFNLEPFIAEYSQMGSTLNIKTSISPDSAVYNIVMSMPDLSNPSRVITDVLGISSKNGEFIYRNFQLPLPTWTYNKASYSDEKVVLEIYSGDVLKQETAISEEPVFDGTFAFWQLAGISRSLNKFSINRWRKNAEGLETGLSSTFSFDRTEVLTVNNQKFNCRVFVVEADNNVKLINFISDSAPYLIKQNYSANGQEVTVLDLVKIF